MTGTVVLANANTYTGTTNVNSGFAHHERTALGTIAGGTVVMGGAALEIQGTITVGNANYTQRHASVERRSATSV